MERLENYPFKVELLLKYGTDLTAMAKLVTNQTITKQNETRTIILVWFSLNFALVSDHLYKSSLLVDSRFLVCPNKKPR